MQRVNISLISNMFMHYISFLTRNYFYAPFHAYFQKVEHGLSSFNADPEICLCNSSKKDYYLNNQLKYAISLYTFVLSWHMHHSNTLPAAPRYTDTCIVLVSWRYWLCLGTFLYHGLLSNVHFHIFT